MKLSKRHLEYDTLFIRYGRVLFATNSDYFLNRFGLLLCISMIINIRVKTRYLLTVSF